MSGSTTIALRRRPSQEKALPSRERGRARIASPRANLPRSSAISPAEAYLAAGSFSIALRQITSRSRGVDGARLDGGTGSSCMIDLRSATSDVESNGGAPTRAR